MIEHGQPGHMDPNLASVCLAGDHDRDGTAFDAMTKACNAATREACGLERHGGVCHGYCPVPDARGSNNRFTRSSNQSFDWVPVCL